MLEQAIETVYSGITDRALRYRGAAGKCDLSFCMHFDEGQRGCSLCKCLYDRKNVIAELKEIERIRRREEYNNEPGSEGLEWDW
jgi:hypothetical protein